MTTGYLELGGEVTATATEPSTHTRTAGHIRTMNPGMATRTAWSTQASSAPAPACAPWASRSRCLPRPPRPRSAIYVATGNVALLADLIHNFGDALTAVPLGAAFLLRSGRAERYAGLAVVFAIFVSACVAASSRSRRSSAPRRRRTCSRSGSRRNRLPR